MKSIWLAILILTAPLAVAKPWDISYRGSLAGALEALRQQDPEMKISPLGQIRDVPVALDLKQASKIEALKEIGRQAGDQADLKYSVRSNQLTVVFKEVPKPAVERGLDGSVRVRFGQAKPELVCQTLDVCAIELEKGEKIHRLDVGDSRWEVSPSMVGEKETSALVLIVRPQAQQSRTRLLVSTNRRVYAITLRSTASADDASDTRLSFLY